MSNKKKLETGGYRPKKHKGYQPIKPSESTGESTPPTGGSGLSSKPTDQSSDKE